MLFSYALYVFLISTSNVWGLIRDIDDNCELWAREGECNTSPGFMWNACIDSCSKFAKDDDEKCHEWADAGECVENARFVQIHCPISCNSGIAWSHWLRRSVGLDELPSSKELELQSQSGEKILHHSSILIGSSVDMATYSLPNSENKQLNTGMDADSFKAHKAEVIIPSDLLTSAYVLKQRLEGYLAGFSDIEGMSANAAPDDFYGVLGLSQGYLYTLRLYGIILRSYVDVDPKTDIGEEVSNLASGYVEECDGFIKDIEMALKASQMRSFSLYSEVKRWMSHLDIVEGYVHSLLDMNKSAKLNESVDTSIPHVNIVPATVAVDVSGGVIGDQFIDIQYREKARMDVDVDGNIMPAVTVVSTSGAASLLENSITPNVYSMIGQYMTTEIVFVNDTVASDPEVMRLHRQIEDMQRQREEQEEEIRQGRKLDAMEVVKQRERLRVEAEMRRKMERVVLEKEQEKERQREKEAMVEAARKRELDKQRADKIRAERLERAIELELEKQRAEHVAKDRRRLESEEAAARNLFRPLKAKENEVGIGGDTAGGINVNTASPISVSGRVLLSTAKEEEELPVTPELNTNGDFHFQSSSITDFKSGDTTTTTTINPAMIPTTVPNLKEHTISESFPTENTRRGAKMEQPNKSDDRDPNDNLDWDRNGNGDKVLTDSMNLNTVNQDRQVDEQAGKVELEALLSELNGLGDGDDGESGLGELLDVDYSNSDSGVDNFSEYELKYESNAPVMDEEVFLDASASDVSDRKNPPEPDEAIFEAEVDYTPRRKRGGRSMAGGPSVKLINGVRMPMIGFGTWQLLNESCVDAVKEAIAVGYRHIDTAQSYNNEDAIGVAVNELIDDGALSRSELFIATKLSNPENGGYLQTKELVYSQIARMNCSYLDLYMLHSPLPHALMQYETWRAIEDLYKEKLIRAIGVSNFNTKQLKVLLNTARIAPMVVQNKYDIYHLGKQLDEEGDDILTFTKSIGALMVAYSSFSAFPFVMKPLDDPIVRFIAYKRSDWQWKMEYNNKHKLDRHSRNYGNSAMTPAQVLLRWTLQSGVAVIPRTSSVQHMFENFQASKIYPPLSPEDMQLLSSIHYFVSTPLTTAV